MHPSALALCLVATVAARASTNSSAGTKSVLVVGDSWGTVLAVGSGENASFFDRKMLEHGCDFHAVSIAIPGTQATDWDKGALLASLVAESVNHDYVSI
jgi:hypothetical protein